MGEVGFASAGDAWRWRGRRAAARRSPRGSLPCLRRTGEAQAQVRIDRYLHCIRLVKSRTLAQAVIETGHVRIDGKRVEKPSEDVRIGSVIALPLHDKVRVLRVLCLPERRGPARKRTPATRSWELTRAAAALSERPQREPHFMTYVVTDACIKCKYMDCVEVCPSTASTRAK